MARLGASANRPQYHTVLKNELGKLRPTVGDQIGIAYHGKDEAKGYERYPLPNRRATSACSVGVTAQLGVVVRATGWER
jgi:hypothetical protein